MTLDTMENDSSKAGEENVHLGCLIAPLIMFLIGTAVLWFATVQPYAQTQDARSWKEVPCTVIKSEVYRVQSGSGRHYDPEPYTYTEPSESDNYDPYLYKLEVSYRYTIDGREYQSDRYDFSEIYDRYKREKEELAITLASQTKAVCYVNPQDFHEAVLSRESPLNLFVTVVAGGIAVLGLIVFTLMAVGWMRTRK